MAEKPPLVRIDQEWGKLLLWSLGIVVGFIVFVSACGPH